MNKPRNPGPLFGYHFLQWADKLIPDTIFLPFIWLGSWVATILMPVQRKVSYNYLAKIADGRSLSVASHFYNLTLDLLLKLRVARGIEPEVAIIQNDEAFYQLVEEKQQVLFGTFHVGHSDLMGFLLKDCDFTVSMIRLKVGNSRDTEDLAKRFNSHVDFIWVNNPEEILFQIKNAIDAGKSLAMKCDRSEFSSKKATFKFMGESRDFPVTIYKMAIIFSLPVQFAVAVPGKNKNSLELYFSKIFSPSTYSKKEREFEANKHFQKVLNDLEEILKKNPYQWFNFNPQDNQ